jgi:hypothetical protein
MASLIDVHWFVVRATDTATDTATETHKCSAVKRSRRAQTVLGDRHDLICEILLQAPSAACGTRPAEFFNGLTRTSICVCAVGTMSCASLQAEPESA